MKFSGTHVVLSHSVVVPYTLSRGPSVTVLLSVQFSVAYTSVSQPPGRGPVPGPGINYTGPRKIPLELITNLNVILYLSTCHTVHLIVLILFMIMS